MTARLIVFEGLDGVGKTSLSQRFAERIGARWLCTPDSALREVRTKIDGLLCEDPIALQLFYSASVSWASTQARAFIAQQQSVVIDRYWASTVVYGSLRGRSIDLDSVQATLLSPAITVWVDVDEELRCERMRQRGATAADNATLLQGRALRAAYERVLSQPFHGALSIIDNTGSLEDSVRMLVARIARPEAA